MPLTPSQGVQTVDPGVLTPHPSNPRTIAPHRLESLERSLAADPDLLGARPLIANADGQVLAGNMRLEAIRVAQGRGGDTRLAAWIAERGGVPTFVVPTDEEQNLRVMVLDNQQYGEWDHDALAGLVVGYEEHFGGDVDLLGVDEAEADMLRTLVAAAREEDLPGPEAAPAPDVTERRRPESWAVTVTFDDEGDRDRFAEELRDQGHERVRAHVGRWDHG